MVTMTTSLLTPATAIATDSDPGASGELDRLLAGARGSAPDAARFAASAGTHFNAVNGAAAVKELLEAETPLLDVIERFVTGAGAMEISVELRSFLVGWCVGLAQLQTALGVEKKSQYEARHGRVHLDDRGQCLLFEAVQRGIVADNAAALRLFGRGWADAVKT